MRPREAAKAADEAKARFAHIDGTGSLCQSTHHTAFPPPNLLLSGEGGEFPHAPLDFTPDI